MALDGIRRVMLHSRLCVLVFGLLLFRQDEDVRLLPDSILLRIHVDFLRGPRRDVRHFGLLRLLRLRAPHLCEYQVGLTRATRSPTTGGALGLRNSKGARGEGHLLRP